MHLADKVVVDRYHTGLWVWSPILIYYLINPLMMEFFSQEYRIHVV